MADDSASAPAVPHVAGDEHPTPAQTPSPPTDVTLHRLDSVLTNGASHLVGAHLVATVVTVGFIGLVVVLAVHAVADSPLMNVLAGALSTGFSTVVNFYMGSSIGSAQKTDQVSKLIASAPLRG